MSSGRDNFAGFEWLTEEDNAPILAPVAAPKPGRRRWFPVVTLVLAAVTIIALFIFRYLERQLDQTTAVASEQVLVTHRLLERAASQQDNELFSTLLPDHDPIWTQVQQDLLETDLFFDRHALGLAPANVEPEIREVYLAPDLGRAEVISRRTYIFDNNGHEETATLAFTSFYHLEQERWQWSPAGAGFWGEWQTTHGDRLVLSYPERDAATAVQLAHDLDAQLADMCQRLDDLNCPSASFLWLYLDSDPQTLNQLADARLILQQGGRKISLPAPALLGIPVDDVAYQAVYRWYAIQIASAVIVGQVEWRCCEHFPFFQALLDKQLNQLELRPWPLDDTQYWQLVQEPPQLQPLARQWWTWVVPVPDFLAEERWLLYAFVDIALQLAPERSIADRQRYLTRSEDFTDWVRYATAREGSLPEIEQALLQLALDRAAQTSPPSEMTLPNQRVSLICSLPPGAVGTDECYR